MSSLLFPCFLKPICFWYSLFIAPAYRRSRGRSAVVGGFNDGLLNGDSSMVLPGTVESGLGVEVSRWLTPPIMKSQMTFFAFERASRGDAVAGARRGQPSEAHADVGEEGRRLTRPQQLPFGRMFIRPSPLTLQASRHRQPVADLVSGRPRRRA
jgi:hypothetical protein